LIEGTAGSSPYLKSLIHKESAWLPEPRPALLAPKAKFFSTNLFNQYRHITIKCKNLSHFPLQCAATLPI